MGLGIVIWVMASIVVLAVIGVVALIVTRRDVPSRRMDPDEMFMLGVIFLGSGIALFVTIGPAMLGLPVMGAIFMIAGTLQKRTR